MRLFSSLLTFVQIEGAADSSSAYHPLEPPADGDETVPPFSTANLPLSTVLTAYLDKARPLSEPRWVKTGDVQDWLKSMFGRMFWAAGDAADGWEKKIEVVDADPVGLRPRTLPLSCSVYILLAAYYMDCIGGVGRQFKRRPTD